MHAAFRIVFGLMVLIVLGAMSNKNGGLDATLDQFQTQQEQPQQSTTKLK